MILYAKQHNGTYAVYEIIKKTVILQKDLHSELVGEDLFEVKGLLEMNYFFSKGVLVNKNNFTFENLTKEPYILKHTSKECLKSLFSEHEVNCLLLCKKIYEG